MYLAVSLSNWIVWLDFDSLFRSEVLDDNSVFYEGIYSTIKEDDYDKIIEYGDYTIMK